MSLLWGGVVGVLKSKSKFPPAVTDEVLGRGVCKVLKCENFNFRKGREVHLKILPLPNSRSETSGDKISVRNKVPQYPCPPPILDSRSRFETLGR